MYYEKRTLSGGQIFGVDPEYLQVCGYQLMKGRNFVEKDYKGFHKVALLDQEAAEKLNELIPGTDSQFKYKAVDLLEQVRDQQKNKRTADLDCGNCPAGWGHRRYEYYACVCNRAYPRDRNRLRSASFYKSGKPESYRCAAA